MFYNTGEHLQQVSFSVSVHISRYRLPRFACHRVSTNGLHHCVELEKLFSLGFYFARFGVRKVKHSEVIFRPERVLRLDFWISKLCSLEPTARAVCAIRPSGFIFRAARSVCCSDLSHSSQLPKQCSLLLQN